MGNVIREVYITPQLSAFLSRSTVVSVNRKLEFLLSIDYKKKLTAET